ncbi:MAG: class I SAM-dependent methyltransferase [Burkholderiales bacterium]|nr:class I SAM-dependent methyltransferase [Burkholderiales bacterium]
METYRSFLRHEAPAPDPDFDRIYVAGLLATGTSPTPTRRRARFIHLVELLRRTRDVPGAVVECGCFQGLSSFVMCSYLKQWAPGFDGSGYHVFDSFEGLSEPTLDDDIPETWDNAANLRLMSYAGNFAASLEQVRKNLAAFPRISFHKGWIPLCFAHLPEARYRFVHVDVDLYDPTLDAFNYFYPRLSAKGIIASDDYTWPGARTAIDDFCAERGITFDVTAHGQAVLVK